MTNFLCKNKEYVRLVRLKKTQNTVYQIKTDKMYKRLTPYHRNVNKVRLEARKT